jgi:hypothetical protein
MTSSVRRRERWQSSGPAHPRDETGQPACHPGAHSQGTRGGPPDLADHRGVGWHRASYLMAADIEPMTDTDLMSIEASLTSAGGVQRLRSLYPGFRTAAADHPPDKDPAMRQRTTQYFAR